jgi:hypothetical protein
LVCERPIHRGVLDPRVEEKVDVVMFARLVLHTGAAREGLNRDLIQAFCLAICAPAQGAIDDLRYVADGVLGRLGIVPTRNAYTLSDECTHIEGDQVDVTTLPGRRRSRLTCQQARGGLKNLRPQVRKTDGCRD